MKSISVFLFAACLVGVASPLAAQVIVMTAKVAPGLFGIYDGPFAVGDPVKVTFDLTAQTGDLLSGTDPDHQEFGMKVGLNIRGMDLPVSTGNPNAIMTVWSDPWLPRYGIATTVGGPGDGPTGFVFRQGLLSFQDILTESKTFPEGVPIGDFWDTEGSLTRFQRMDDGSFVADSRISWQVTSYEGASALFPAVPEPATYGMFASGGMALLVFLRRRFQSLQPKIT